MPTTRVSGVGGWVAAFRSNFEPGDLSRGWEYAAAGRVEQIVHRGNEIFAAVRGTRIYDVGLTQTGADAQVSCTCHRFADGYLCKHIAALLVELDRGGRIKAPSPAHGASTAHAPESGRPAWAATLDQFEYGARHLWDGASTRAVGKIWYALELHAMVAKAERTVVVGVYEETANWRAKSPTRRLPVSVAVSDLPEPLDQELVAMLRELAGDRWRWSNRPGRTELPHRLAYRVLGDLAASGRFVLQTDPKVWSSGPKVEIDPGRWWLRVHVAPEADGVAVRAELESEGRRLLLRDVEVIADGCLALHGATVMMIAPVLTVRRLHLLGTIDGLTAPAHQSWPLVERMQRLPIEGLLDVDEGLLPEVEHHRPRMQVNIEFAPGTRVVARIAAIYDNVGVWVESRSVRITDPSAPSRLLERDLGAEERAIEALESAAELFGFRSGGTWQLDRHQLQDFIEQATALDWVVAIGSRRVRPFGRVSGSLDQREGWFELHLLASFDGALEPIDAEALLDADDLGLVELADGSLGLVPDALRRRLDTLGLLGRLEGGALRYRSAQALLLDGLVGELELRADRELQTLWQRARQRGKTIAAADPPPSFTGDLRPYQREGLGWLEATLDGGYGVCLADDMGLGKTVQVLALLARRHTDGAPRGPSLVVAPRSVVHNWIAEAAKFAPSLRVAEYGGRDRRHLLGRSGELDLLVTTYALVRSDAAALREQAFDLLIIDEAQHVKNRETQAHAALSVLRTNHRIALSGTPVENRLDDLWSVLELLNPGLLGRLPRARQVTNLELDTVAKAVRPFLLRRTKAEVLKDLPERTEQTLLVEMEPAQRKVYDQLRRAYRESLLGRVKRDGIARSKIYVLEALLRLRQAACHPVLVDAKYAKTPSAKLDLLIERLDELAAEGHKVLVFSQFTSLLSLVEPRLSQRKIGWIRLDGRTKNRAERVARFSDDPDASVFLISLKAGGTGLNLTAASYVFLLDPWWNPAVEAQAIDRSHRIGQTRAVTAYRLVVQGTVEERILELQDSKRRLADAILSADTSVARQLTVADLEMLLG